MSMVEGSNLIRPVLSAFENARCLCAPNEFDTDAKGELGDDEGQVAPRSRSASQMDVKSCAVSAKESLADKCDGDAA